MKKILLVLFGLMFLGSTINAQWNQFLTSQESLIRDISVVNDNVVWIKDQNNVQFSITTDGGNNWITKNFPTNMTKIVGGFSAVSATTAYIVVSTGSNLGIYKTTNSGDSWVKQTSGFNSTNSYPDFVYFWNENEGVAVGDGYSNLNFEVYTTVNGGTTWNLAPALNFPTTLSDYSYNGNSTYKIIGNSIYFKTYKGKIYKSIDKGSHWSSISTPLTNGDNVSFDFKDANNGLLYSYSTSSTSPVLYSTINAGQNWIPISTSNIYGNIKYIPSQSVYFSTGSNYGLSYSSDNGQTWTVHPSFQNAGLSGVGLAPSGKIFMGGWKYIYWTSNYTGVNPSVNQMKITDANKIDLTFSKDMESVSSQNIANYSVSYKQKPDNSTTQTTYPIEVISAMLDNANKSLVHLVTKNNFPIDTINANVINVKDLNGFQVINRSTSAFVSDIYNSLNVSAGKLSTLLSSNDLATISNLKLTGTIDVRDFVTMRDKMPKLTTLDLSGASISAYTGTDGTAGKSNYMYPVNEIPQNAFYKILTSGFIPLSSIKLPSTATSIGGSAFYACCNLKSILISSSITSIKESAFLGIGGLINVDAANPNYTSVDGILFNKAKTKLIQCSPLVAIGNYNIPTTVVAIGTGAFAACLALTSVNIPMSVTTIEDIAFKNCSHLQSIYIPSSVDSIGTLALDINGSITVDTLNLKYSSLNGVLYSKNKAVILQCPTSKNEIFKIPASVTTIGNYAFGNYESGFSNSIFSISIPISVSTIKTKAFAYCSSLTSIQVYPSVPPVLISTDSVFLGVNKNACYLYVPVGTKSLYQNAPQWKDFVNIVEGTIPTSKTINLTFPGSLSTSLTQTEKAILTKLTITGSIDARDFVTMRDNMPVLSDIDLSGAMISAYSGTLGTYSTSYTNYPANVTPSRAFYYPYTTNNNDGTFLLSHGKETLNYVNLPESIVGIGMSTFAYCSNLKSVTIHSSVTSIEQSAFYSCNGLISGELPVSVKNIGTYAFWGCTGLKSINIPSSVPSIGDYTFYNCNSLKSVVLPEGMTSIGSDAFNNCDSLKSVTIPSTVTSIGDYAFTDCHSLIGALDISSNVINIGESAFNGCYNLNSLTIGSKIKTIQDGTFGLCLGLKSITIPSTVSYIGSQAFGLCSGLTSLNISQGVDSIGYAAFWGCTKIESITIPSSVTSIGSSSFMSCSNLKSATISNGVTTIGDLAFANATIFNKGFSNLANMPRSFIVPTGNSELKTIKIPTLVSSIGVGAFLGCTDSISVDVANQKYSNVSGLLFNKDKSILIQCPNSKKGSYNIPETVRFIEGFSFFNCSELTSINISKGVDSIGRRAFYGCSSLKSIYANNPLPVKIQTNDSVFNLVDKTTCILYVPKGSKADYQAANQWKDFVNIVEITTAVPTLKDECIRIFISPATDAICVNGLNTKGMIKLFDINGRLLQVKQILNNESVSVGLLPKGIYIVKLITDEGTVSRKIIKK